MLNMVLKPGGRPSTWTRMEPPFFWTSSRLIQRPMPVPRLSLVVKKGSKMLLRWSRGIPPPLSRTLMQTDSSPTSSSTSIRPPGPVTASQALERTLVRI
jgi:hypothetical protein